MGREHSQQTGGETEESDGAEAHPGTSQDHGGEAQRQVGKQYYITLTTFMKKKDLLIGDQ